jgi:hypothetical protein
MINNVLSKLKSKKSLYIGTSIVLIAVIVMLILLIVAENNNYSLFEFFGDYNPKKCEAKAKQLKKDQLYDKVKNVDIVYMWVDGEDAEWQKRTHNRVGSRNRSNNELIYSLRSVAKFMPWHEGRIFIVTPNQIPPKLRIDNKQITVIDQNSIMPSEVGQTANSFMIEVFLHKIPGLTDNFIYMNDDYFLGQPLLPEDFFTLHTNGDLRPKFYSNKYVINGGTKQSNDFFKKKQKLWLAATYTTNGMVEEEYGKKKRFYLEHAPYMFNKHWCEEVVQKWDSQFKSMYSHKRRHWKDVVFVLLYRYYCIDSGKPCDIVHEMDKVFLQLVTDNNERNVRFYKKVCDQCPKFFTLNDEYSKDETKKEMTSFLEDFFHEKSKYEI